MKTLLSLFVLFFLLSVSSAQDTGLNDDQIAAQKRLEEIKQEYLSENYLAVINYYDSIRSTKPYAGVVESKLASLSCIELSKGHEDSLSLVEKSYSIYNNVVQWFGKKHMLESWENLDIKPLEKPDQFSIVDEHPRFPGGMGKFYEYVYKEMRYPEAARRLGVEGSVYIQFIVNKDGSLDGINVIKGIGAGCDEEALRVVQNSPNFIAGSMDGKPVYVRMILPITFKIAGSRTTKKKKKK